jgi:Flp pilus assembly protein TadG
MKLKLIRADTRGGALVEFTVTVPLFLSLMFGLVQAGLLLFTQSGLQHGVESAARCASVNYSANQLGLSQSCFTVSGKAVAPSAVTHANIQQYAAEHSWGIVPSSSSFTVACPAGVSLGCASAGSNKCGGTAANAQPGYLVSVRQPYNLIKYIFSMSLTATSCFPINVS